VLDEADTMFDRGFGPEVRAVLGPLRSKAAPARVVLVCATMTPVRRPAARPRSGPVACGNDAVRLAGRGNAELSEVALTGSPAATGPAPCFQEHQAALWSNRDRCLELGCAS